MREDRGGTASSPAVCRHVAACRVRGRLARSSLRKKFIDFLIPEKNLGPISVQSIFKQENQSNPNNGILIRILC